MAESWMGFGPFLGGFKLMFLASSFYSAQQSKDYR
jgi:hypothetical protein